MGLEPAAAMDENGAKVLLLSPAQARYTPSAGTRTIRAPSCGLAPLTHTCTRMVQCWIRQIQARMHAYMLQRKRYWAELAWQVMSHSTVGSNFIPRKHVRAKLVYVCVALSIPPSNLHLTLTHCESTTPVFHVAGVTSTGTSTAITLPSMSDSARRAA